MNIRDKILRLMDAPSAGDPSTWPRLILPLGWKDHPDIHPDLHSYMKRLIETGEAIWDIPIEVPLPQPDPSGSKYIPSKPRRQRA